MARAACIGTCSCARLCQPEITGGIALRILRHGGASEATTHERHLHLRSGVQQADFACVVVSSIDVHETIAENERRLITVERVGHRISVVKS